MNCDHEGCVQEATYTTCAEVEGGVKAWYWCAEHAPADAEECDDE